MIACRYRFSACWAGVTLLFTAAGLGGDVDAVTAPAGAAGSVRIAAALLDAAEAATETEPDAGAGVGAGVGVGVGAVAASFADWIGVGWAAVVANAVAAVGAAVDAAVGAGGLRFCIPQ